MASWPHRLQRLHGFLVELNNLLLIPLFAVITVDLVALGLGIPSHDVTALEEMNDAVCALFFSEWALGLAIAEDRRAYLTSLQRNADLVSSIPFGYVFQSLRLVRVARILRLVRIVWRMRRLQSRLRDILRVAGLVTATGFAGAVALRMFEPQTVKSLEDAMWWAIVTMSTVGYGDIFPVSGPGRAVAMTMIVIGIAIFGYAITVLTSVITNEDDKQAEVLATLRRIEARLDALERQDARKPPD